MLKVANQSFGSDTSCTSAIYPTHFNHSSISCFDNDGFELSKLEQEMYYASGFSLGNHLNHNCLQYQWITMTHNDNFVLDHSLLLERKDFQQEARQQIESFVSKFPQLRKYLKVKPKWGFDFALEYYKDEYYFEVLHVEYDYNDLDTAIEQKDKFQNKIIETDWNDFVLVLQRRKEQWINLKGFQQNDYKARLWGLIKAEDTLKSFL